MDKNRQIEIMEEWETIVADITEAEWVEEWKKAYPEIATQGYKVGDIVDYYGKRCKIIEVDKADEIFGGGMHYLLQTADEREQSYTWWVGESAVTKWRGGGNGCECGAFYVKGWENFHSPWCPKYKQR